MAVYAPWPDETEQLEARLDQAREALWAFEEKHLRGGKPSAHGDGRRALTDEEARTIREEYAAGRGTQEEIGARYGVCGVTISDVVRGHTYRRAGGPITRTRHGRTHRLAP